MHDIGIKNAELNYNSSAGHYQEIEGPPVAEEIDEVDKLIERLFLSQPGKELARKIFL